MAEEKTEKQHRFTEQIEIAGQDLVERVKEILAEGNVRQLRIKAADGDVFFRNAADNRRHRGRRRGVGGTLAGDPGGHSRAP